jgi:DNA-binding response OmpR family regulator
MSSPLDDRAPLRHAHGTGRQRGGDARRAVVVDDDRDMAHGLKLVLELWGMTVAVFHDGLAALAGARELHPEVVLLDIGLPKLDGLQLARQIRAGRPRGEVLLIALTGFGGERERQSALAAGFDECLVKPVDAQTLRRILLGDSDG